MIDRSPNDNHNATLLCITLSRGDPGGARLARRQPRRVGALRTRRRPGLCYLRNLVRFLRLNWYRRLSGRPLPRNLAIATIGRRKEHQCFFQYCKNGYDNMKRLLLTFSVVACLLAADKKDNSPAEAAAGWRKYPSNPVLGGSLGTCFDVSVLREDDHYRMWFSW